MHGPDGNKATGNILQENELESVRKELEDFENYESFHKIYVCFVITAFLLSIFFLFVFLSYYVSQF